MRQIVAKINSNWYFLSIWAQSFNPSARRFNTELNQQPCSSHGWASSFGGPKTDRWHLLAFHAFVMLHRIRQAAQQHRCLGYSFRQSTHQQICCFFLLCTFSSLFHWPVLLTPMLFLLLSGLLDSLFCGLKGSNCRYWYQAITNLVSTYWYL